MKSWPYFKDWAVIFGKDRATGENSEQVIEAINDFVRNDKGKSPVSNTSQYVNNQADPTSFQSESEFTLDNRAESALSPHKKNKLTNKRQRIREQAVTPVADMMSAFFEKIDAKLGNLVTKVGIDHDLTYMRQQVTDALEPICTLTKEEKLEVAMVICEMQKTWTFFFTSMRRSGSLWLI